MSATNYRLCWNYIILLLINRRWLDFVVFSFLWGTYNVYVCVYLCCFAWLHWPNIRPRSRKFSFSRLFVSSISLFLSVIHLKIKIISMREREHARVIAVFWIWICGVFDMDCAVILIIFFYSSFIFWRVAHTHWRLAW